MHTELILRTMFAKWRRRTLRSAWAEYLNGCTALPLCEINRTRAIMAVMSGHKILSNRVH